MWFDSLPFHPAPYPLESFTGYLVRLAEGNQIRSKSALSAIAFPNLKRKTDWTDLPRREYGDLPSVTTHPEAVFHATTFYHLARKLRRSLYAGTSKILLAGSIVERLRYCPRCLIEQGHYSLLWRFTALEGCSKHGCFLLEECGQCGASIPLLPTALRLGICPACSARLGDSVAEALPMEHHRQVDQLESDLRFLLTPQVWEADLDSLHSFGTALATMRRAQGWSQVQTATQLGISEEAMSGLEGRAGAGRGETFDDYLRYLRLLGTSFHEVFTYSAHLMRVDQGQQWLECVQQTIEYFKTTQQPLTQQAICQHLGCQPKTLKRFPEIVALLKTLPEQHLARRVEQLRQRIEASIQHLQAKGQPISLEALAPYLDIQPESLRHYPDLWRYISSLKPAKPARPPLPPLSAQRQAELRQQVEATIEVSLQLGTKLTDTEIYRRAHMSPATFYRYPLLKELVNQARVQHPTPPSRPNEALLLEQVKVATQTLVDTGQAFSCRAVAQMVGMSPPSLRHYPSIQVFFKAQLQQHKLEQNQQLLSQVQAAAQQLTTQTKPVTQRGVARLLGISPQKLHHHRYILDYLNSFADYNTRLHLQEQQQRETHLRDAVLSVIEQMRVNKHPLTQQAVAQALHTSSQGLKSYPSIRPIMEAIKQNARSSI